IVTNVDGKCYNYAAFIDESRIGKLILLNETETTEPNGTEIIVPIKSQDFNAFINSTEHCTRHWKVKPTIKGRQLSWHNVDPIINGNHWFVAQNYNSYYHKNIRALVGEIEYALDINAIRQFCNLDVLNALTGDLYLKFNVGEVGLAANRETIYLDPPTKEIIKERISQVKDEYVTIIKNRVNACADWHEANCFVDSDLSTICQNANVLGSLTWNNIPIAIEIRNSDDINTIAFSRREKYGIEKISRTYCNGIRFSRKSKIIIHDCGEVEPSVRHVKKFFEENKEINNLYVVSPGKNVSMEDMLSTYHLDQIDLEMLSKHNSNIKNRKAASTSVRTLVYKLEKNNDSFALTSAASLKEDTKQKVVVYLEKDSWKQNAKISLRKDKATRVSSSILNSILKMDDSISIYGIDKETPEIKVKELFGKQVKYIDDQLDSIIAQNSREYLLESIWATRELYADYMHYLSYTESLHSSISDQDSLFMSVLAETEKVSELVFSRREYL
ncbi:MAG: hypothetical protein EB127_25510, partial [Alphaproteobacteria bacterium]|nr:hypothetical protein [Alphaproteobacteria bacterium]